MVGCTSDISPLLLVQGLESQVLTRGSLQCSVHHGKTHQHGPNDLEGAVLATRAERGPLCDQVGTPL